MQITDRLIDARSRLKEAVTSRDRKSIASEAYRVIVAWAWRPGSEIASIYGRFSVEPLPGVWWRVTLDLGIAWERITCRVEQEIPLLDLPMALEHCLGVLEREWVRDESARAEAADELIVALRLPPEVGPAMRRALVSGERPVLDTAAARHVGERLGQYGVLYSVADGDLCIEPDLRWPPAPRVTSQEWRCYPLKVWGLVETYGRVVLTDEGGTEVGAISKPMGALDDGPGNP